MNIARRLDITLDKLCEILNVENPYNNLPITKIVHLRRSCVPGCACFAFKNWNIDSNSSVEYAIEHGAAVIVAEKEIPGVKCIVVEDALHAYLTVARWCLQKLGLTTISVAGSIGKTSTKNMLYYALSECCNVDMSKKNMNSAELAAMNVFEMEDDFDVLVQESTIHDIDALSWCVQPQYVVLTNIGLSHSESFGDKESILNRKIMIAKHLFENGVLVLNVDDPLLCEYASHSKYNLLTYGIENHCADCRAINIVNDNNKTEFDICYKGQTKHCCVLSVGNHNVLNALAAYVIGVEMGFDIDCVLKGINKWQPEGNRNNFINKDGKVIYVDCFNASSDSMIGAIKTIKKIQITGRKIAVLADILELGKYSSQEHRRVGKYINNESDIDVLILYGPLAKEIGEEITRKDIHILATLDRDELKNIIERESKQDDLLLFKASHGMALDEIVDRLYGTNFTNMEGYHNSLWLRLRKMGVNISKILSDCGYNRVSLFGYNGVGRNLAKELQEEGLEVEYIVDNRIKYAKKNTYNFKMISEEGIFPPTDIMIVCLLQDKEKIIESCKLKCNSRVVHYLEFENEIRRLYKEKTN